MADFRDQNALSSSKKQVLRLIERVLATKSKIVRATLAYCARAPKRVNKQKSCNQFERISGY